MGEYSVAHTVAVGTNLTMINCIGTAAIRLKLFYVVVGSASSPADDNTEFRIIRTTAVGAGGTTLTVSPLDPFTVAATGTATGGTFTTQPTYGSNILLELPHYQRSPSWWMAAPGGELIAVAAASNGLGLRSISSTGSYNINANMHWSE